MLEASQHKDSPMTRTLSAMIVPLVAASIAHASILYGSSNETIFGGNEFVYTIDQQTGAATPLGPSGVVEFRGITSDWRSESFRIWGVEWLTNELVSIDPQTGAATTVGEFGTITKMDNLAFDIHTESLFGMTAGDTLHKIDIETGHATLIGDPGFDLLGGMAFDLSGNLFAVATAGDWLIQIDTATGAGTAIGKTINAVAGLAARPEDGVMFLTETETDTIRTIDLETGQTTIVGPYGGGIEFLNGLAFSPVPPPATPTLFALAGAAGARRRR